MPSPSHHHVDLPLPLLFASQLFVLVSSASVTLPLSQLAAPSVALPCALRFSSIFGTIDLAGTDGPGMLPFALAGPDALPFALTGTLPLPAVAVPALHRHVRTNYEEDHLHGYMTPIIRGHQLCIINIDRQLSYPIYPGQANRQWTWDASKNHVLGIVNSNAQDDKKRSCHRGLARNEGWLPLPFATDDKESGEE